MRGVLGGGRFEPPPHPRSGDAEHLAAQVAGAALGQGSGCLDEGAVLVDRRSQLRDALAAGGLGAQDRHLPALGIVGEREDAAHLAHHRVGHRVVGLVDDDHVGDLHHAGLQRLDRVAGAGHQRQHDRVGVVDDVDLRLADADGLDQDVVLAGRVHHQRHLQGRLGEAAESAPRGHRADEDAGVEEVVGEADAVAEQGAAGEGAGGIDREHRDLALGSCAAPRSTPRSGCSCQPPAAR